MPITAFGKERARRKEESPPELNDVNGVAAQVLVRDEKRKFPEDRSDISSGPVFRARKKSVESDRSLLEQVACGGPMLTTTLEVSNNFEKAMGGLKKRARPDPTPAEQ